MIIISKIYIVRHGVTDWNIEGRLQGREDIPLNDEGRTQAEKCGEALAEIKFDMIISSPLSRAMETAQIIAESSKTGLGEIIVEDGLIERDYGSGSGALPSGIDIFNPEKYISDMEPIDNVCRRAIEVIRRRAAQCSGNILAVSHGGVINAMLWYLSDGQTGHGKIRLKNACINIFELKEDQISICAYNLMWDEI